VDNSATICCTLKDEKQKDEGMAREGGWEKDGGGGQGICEQLE